MTDEPILVDIAAQCLEAMEAEGQEALERFCREYPEHSDALRRLVQELGPLLAPSTDDSGSSTARLVRGYRIERRVGSGGMGAVFQATHEDSGRRVALKLLHPHGAIIVRARERFRREIEALRRLDHPNLCQILEADAEGETPYIAMPFIEGETLAERLKTRLEHGELPDTAEIGELTAIFETCARALQSAHETDLLHRDVKPANIIIARNGDPILLDFGLAVETEPVERSRLTKPGDVLGTPSYMAPEQIDPRIGEPGPRTDVYSLGMSAYECMTLQCAYEGRSREELYRRILKGEAPEPRTINPAISKDLSVVIRRAIAADPNERFDTALDFAEEFGRVRTGRPVLTRRRNPVQRALRWIRRNPMAAALFVVLGIGLATALLLLRENDEQRRRRLALAMTGEGRSLTARLPRLSFEMLRRAGEIAPEALDAIAAPLQEAMSRLHEAGKRNLGGQLEHVFASSDRTRLLAYGDTVEPHLIDASSLAVVKKFERGSNRFWYRAACFSPDGKRVAIGDVRGRLRRFETQRGELLEERDLHGGEIRAVDWSGDRLLSVGADGTAFLTRDGAEPVELEPDEAGAWSKGLTFAKLSKDARFAIVADLERAWVFHDERCVWSTKPSKLVIRVLEVGPGRFGLGRVGSAEVYRISADAHQPSVSRVGRFVCSLDLSRTDSVLIGSAGRVIVDPSKGGRLSRRSGGLTHARWTADGRILAARWSPPSVCEFAIAGPQLVQTRMLSGHLTGAKSVARIGPNRVASCAWDGTVRLWNLAPPVPRHGLLERPDHIRTIFDGRVLTVSMSGKLRLWSADGHADVAKPLRVPGMVYSVELSESRNGVVITTARGSWYVDLEAWRTRKLELPMATIGNEPYTVLPLGDRRYIVSGTNGVFSWAEGGAAKRFESIDPRPLTWQLERVPGSADRFMLARGRQVEMRDARGELIRSFEGPRASISDLSFSQDGQTVVAACQDAHAYLWPIEGGKPQVFAGHVGELRSAELHPDGTRLFTASYDRSVLVWDRASGRILQEFRGFANGVEDLALTMDGKRLVTGCNSGDLAWWMLDSDEVWRMAKKIEMSPFSAAEQARLEGLLARHR